jgi:hypothetical protein
VRALAAAAQQVGSIGEAAVHQARAALRAPHALGPQRVAAIKALAVTATTADDRLGGVSLGPNHALVGFLRSRYDDFATRLDKVRSGVHRGALAAQATARLFAGPSHLLLLGANNAEMRNGSGMFLSAAEVDIVDGTLTLGPVRSTGDLAMVAGAPPATGPYAAPWGAFLANEDFRNLGVSARFDETAALAAQMWKADTGQRVDGVVAIDIAGVQALLTATGPVEAGTETVAAGNVVQLLMHDQYLGSSGASADVQARREELGAIADAALAAVQRGGYSAGGLAGQLPAVVSGRHLLLWSSDPALEQSWQGAGVAGTLRADSLLAAVQNMGANKLDRFVTVSTDVAIAPGVSTTRVTATIHLSNATPGGQPDYIAGNGVGGEPPYTYRAYVTLTMPVSAQKISVDRRTVAQVSGADGPTRVVAVLRDVPAGRSATVVVTFELPVAHGHLQIESSARVPAATMHILTVPPSPPVPDSQRPRVQW